MVSLKLLQHHLKLPILHNRKTTKDMQQYGQVVKCHQKGQMSGYQIFQKETVS